LTEPRIAKLGHVGLYVRDLERQAAFYRDVLGLSIADGSPQARLVFLSARPDHEHHELLVVRALPNEGPTQRLNQISFRCEAITDVIGFYRRLVSHGVTFDRIVSHGTAIGVHFFDPEDNRCEVYCPTGLEAKQPFVLDIDITRPVDELMRDVEAAGGRYRDTGIVQKRGEAP
jgi:catechol 2,3-dioxygenase-like lactoylglutathione lyase family enzyme